MMKSEFVSKVIELGGASDFNEQCINEDDWEVIQTVYMFHPSIPEVNGKEAIARIWMLPAGMRIIRDMTATAKAEEQIEDEMLQIRREISQMNKKLEELARKKKNL